jgi:hypothetical protein
MSAMLSGHGGFGSSTYLPLKLTSPSEEGLMTTSLLSSQPHEKVGVVGWGRWNTLL